MKAIRLTITLLIWVSIILPQSFIIGYTIWCLFNNTFPMATGWAIVTFILPALFVIILTYWLTKKIISPSNGNNSKNDEYNYPKSK